MENLASLSLSSLKLETPEVQVAGYSRNDAETGMLKLEYQLDGLKISGTKEYLDEIKANPSKITAAITYENDLTAPVFKGDVVGTAALKYGEETLAVVELTAARDVLSAGDPAISSQPSGLITDVPRSSGGSSFPWKNVLIVAAVILVASATVWYFKQRKRGRRRGAMHGRQTGRRNRKKSYSYYLYRGGKKK